MDGLPAGFGPYRVVGEIGRGGMGVVYRAIDARTAAAVAVKTVTAPDGAFLASIRREIRALSRLDHPGVARMLGEGVERGVPWYAMELLTGTTLRSLMEAQWAPGWRSPDAALAAWREAPTSVGDRGPPRSRLTSPAPRPRVAPATPVLDIVRRLCEPLGYIHGRGVVHRDLKPENVFVRLDGTPVLVDFGIAAQAGARSREALEGPGEVLGSHGYMAPEQVRGDLVDARADLYALGCLLFEAVAGEVPFSSALLAVVLQRHLLDAPTPLSSRVPDVAPALEDLVQQLLAKNPRHRPGYAADVEAALAGLLGRRAGRAEPAHNPAGETYLYRPGFTGRARLLDDVTALIDDAVRTDRCQVTLLAGDSGLGKTRLAMEVARTAQQRGLEVVVATCTPSAAHGGDRAQAEPLAPLRPLLVAIADRCRALGRAATVLLGGRTTVLAAYEPAIAAMIGGTPPPPPTLPPHAAQQRVLRALRDTLAIAATSAPILLVIDDLQWADELTLAFLASLQAEPLAARAAVLATFRDDDAPAELVALAHRGGVHLVTLPHLDRASTEQIAGDMLATTALPPWFVDLLHGRADGNPFFVAEHLHALIERGLLRRGHAGAWALEGADAVALTALPPPGSILEIETRRLERLDAHGQALVRLAAVLGREVELAELLAAWDGDELTALDALEAARVRHVLEDLRDGRIRFVHDALRDAAYASLEPVQRRALHRRAGDVLAARATAADDRAVPIGRHFAAAGAPADAAIWFERAGDRARALYANRDAAASYRAAAEQAGQIAAAAPATPPRTADSPVIAHGGRLTPPGEPALRIRIAEKLGDVLAVSGHPDEALAAYATVLAEPELPVLVRVRVHRRVGYLWQNTHRWDRAVAAYQLADAAAPDAPAADDRELWGEWMQARIDHIAALDAAGREAEMAALVTAVAPVVARHAAPVQRSQLDFALALIALRRERFVASAATLARMEQALADAAADGDGYPVCAAQSGLATMRLARDELDHAVAGLREALAGAERIDDLQMQVRCLIFLAAALRRTGDLDAADDLARRGLAAATEAGMDLYIAAAHAHQAGVALRRGDAPTAHRLGHQAVAMWESHGGGFPFEWFARVPLLVVAHATGELDVAAQHARALVDTAQQRLPGGLDAALARVALLGSLGDRAALGEAVETCVSLATELRHL